MDLYGGRNPRNNSHYEIATNRIIVGGFEALPQDNGTFLYKAIESPISFSEKKPTFKEKPQYPLIEQYENVAKKRYKEELSSTVLDIVKFLKNI